MVLKILHSLLGPSGILWLVLHYTTTDQPWQNPCDDAQHPLLLSKSDLLQAYNLLDTHVGRMDPIPRKQKDEKLVSFNFSLASGCKHVKKLSDVLKTLMNIEL